MATIAVTHSTDKDEMQLYVDVPRHGKTALPAVVGCPFAEGALTDTSELRLLGPDGLLPLSARPLVQWPDGSVRWALLTFTAAQPGLHTVTHDASLESPQPDHPAWVQEDSKQVRLGNEHLSITLPRQGVGPISSLTCDDWEYVTKPDALQFKVDGASSLHGTVESVEVVASSPLCAAAVVSGDHRDTNGQRRFSYRLRVEVWTGLSTVRLDYQFFNLEPGASELKVDGISMIVEPSLGAPVNHRFVQRHHGLGMKPRMVETARQVEIRSDWAQSVSHMADRAMLEDSMVYPAYLECSCTQTDDWLGLTGGERGVYMYLHEMAQLRPKSLIADEGRIQADFWPEAAGALTVSQGRSRRHTLTLAFASAQAPAAQVREQATAPLHEGRVTLPPKRLRELAVFDQDRALIPGQYIRLERYLHQLMRGVELGTGLFDYGDGTESGYFVHYVKAAKQPLRPGAAPTGNAMRADSPDAIHPADPDRYEPVWANNEYDLIHAVGVELMRTGQRDLWPLLRALARHQIEVDFVHYSDDPWQHHGSPAHSAYHNLASAYPSHLWTQGLLEYYCLTGDDDALDVSIKLGDTIIRNLDDPVRGPDFWGFNREIGWALLSLVQLEEMTGLPRFGAYADRVADYLAGYDREAQAYPVNLSNVDPLENIHSQIAGAFFGYVSMVEAIDRHARLTGRTDLRDWLTDLIEKVRQAAVQHCLAGRIDGRVLTCGMAIGYELTHDHRFLDTGMVMLEALLDSPDWINPPTEVKAVAMLHRGLIRFLFHADAAGLLEPIDYRHRPV